MSHHHSLSVQSFVSMVGSIPGAFSSEMEASSVASQALHIVLSWRYEGTLRRRCAQRRLARAFRAWFSRRLRAGQVPPVCPYCRRRWPQYWGARCDVCGAIAFLEARCTEGFLAEHRAAALRIVLDAERQLQQFQVPRP